VLACRFALALVSVAQVEGARVEQVVVGDWQFVDGGTLDTADVIPCTHASSS
jgi:hypothetical protein